MAKEDRVRRITDQQQLFEIAMSHESIDFRISAVETISNKTLLKKLFFETKCIELQLAIIKKIEDYSFLCTIALDESQDSMIRVLALQNLDNQKIADKLVLSTDPFIRRTAITKVRDQMILARILRESEDHILRKRAVERITDKELLKETLQSDDSPLVTETAFDRLRELEKLSIDDTVEVPVHSKDVGKSMV